MPGRLVVDANVLIAAFLKESVVRRILTVPLIDLYAPEFLWQEIRKHLVTLRRRAGLSKQGAEDLLGLLERYVTTLPAEVVLPHWERARTAMDPIDPKDAAYIAAALGGSCDGVWSDDPHLKAQRLVPCWTTNELVRELRTHGLKL